MVIYKIHTKLRFDRAHFIEVIAFTYISMNVAWKNSRYLNRPRKSFFRHSGGVLSDISRIFFSPPYYYLYHLFHSFLRLSYFILCLFFHMLIKFCFTVLWLTQWHFLAQVFFFFGVFILLKIKIKVKKKNQNYSCEIRRSTVFY